MDPLFKVHLLNPAGIEKAHYIAQEFDTLLTLIGPMMGDCREAAICRTKLEEASFFAKKAMANQRENQRNPEPESAEHQA